MSDDLIILTHAVPCDACGGWTWACMPHICQRPRWWFDWRRFAKAAEQRMEQGHREYGGRSFDATGVALLGELQQELLDVAGWASIMYQRVEAMRRALEERA